MVKNVMHILDFSTFQDAEALMPYSSTNRGGLSRGKSSPSSPVRGLSCLASWPRVFPLTVSLTRFFQGMAPDTVIRTIQPNGLYATADLYGSSRRLATRAKHAPEDFHGRLRDELLNGEIFYTLLEAKALIEQWRRHYNHVRPHSALGYKPPAPAARVPWPSIQAGAADLAWGLT